MVSHLKNHHTDIHAEVVPQLAKRPARKRQKNAATGGLLDEDTQSGHSPSDPDDDSRGDNTNAPAESSQSSGKCTVCDILRLSCVRLIILKCVRLG